MKTQKTLFLLLVPLGTFLSFAAYTWHQTTHTGPFLHFPDANPNIVNQKSMEVANRKLVADITGLAKPEMVNPYLESIGFSCKSFFGEDLKKRMASKDEFSNHYCVYSYGLFGKTHEWRVGYGVLSNRMLRSVIVNQICLVCP